MQARLGQDKYGKKQALLGAGRKLQTLSCLRRARTAFHMNEWAGAKAWKWNPPDVEEGQGGVGRTEAEQGV